MNLIPAATTSIYTGLAQYSRESREVNPTLENQQEGESEILHLQEWNHPPSLPSPHT